MEKSVEKSLLLLGLYIFLPQTAQTEPHFTTAVAGGTQLHTHTNTHTHSLTDIQTHTLTNLLKVLKAS